MKKKAAKKKAPVRQRKLKPAMQVLSETTEIVKVHYRPGSDPQYRQWLDRQRLHFRVLMDGNDEQLFTTDVADLFDIYLKAIPKTVRQHYNCHACRRFINTYGGLVAIGEDGHTMPVMWLDENMAPADIAQAILALQIAVSKARVTGVFYDELVNWGEFRTGDWYHMAVKNPRPYESVAYSDEQAMAAKRENFKTVQTALNEFDASDLMQALSILQAEQLPQPEKFIGPVEFLLKMHQHRNVSDKHRKTALMWREIAAAPEGFCHPRSSMIGTLLTDLKSSMGFEQVKRRFSEKMHPLKYQRPQAAPAAGTIVQAEQLFEKMGLARSLERRYATVYETPLLWSPSGIGHNDTSPQVTQSLQVFGHLTPKEFPRVTSARRGNPLSGMLTRTVTWIKFQQDILPHAIEIEMLVPSPSTYHALTTAVHADAPRILQWANPFAWYTYVRASDAAQWGLVHGRWTSVTGITSMPNQLEPGFEHHGKGALFFLAGAKDRSRANICLFPNLLRGELHGVRSVIEAHSKSRQLSYPPLLHGETSATQQRLACGLAMRDGSAGGWGTTIRVRTSMSVLDYQLDRWD